MHALIIFRDTFYKFPFLAERMRLYKYCPLATYLVVTYKALSMPEMEILCCKENDDYEDC